KAFAFPEPQVPGLNFSFRGLKTAVLYFVQQQQAAQVDFLETNLDDVCASVQSRLVSILLNKLRRAARETGVSHVAIAGGVSANSGLRNGLMALGEQEGWQVFIPRFEYCTDNAAMIAVAGHYKYLVQEFVGQEVAPMARYAI